MKIVKSQLKALPPRTKAAQEKEMGEMMGKLKQVSNVLPDRLYASLWIIAWEWHFEALWPLYRQF